MRHARPGRALQVVDIDTLPADRGQSRVCGVGGNWCQWCALLAAASARSSTPGKGPRGPTLTVAINGARDTWREVRREALSWLLLPFAVLLVRSRMFEGFVSHHKAC